MASFASPSTIHRKQQSDLKPAQSMASAGAQKVSLKSAAAQVHRSLKAWRDEAPAAEPAQAEQAGKGPGEDEKLDEQGGDKAKPAAESGGGDKSAAAGAAFDASADKGGATAGGEAAATEAKPAGDEAAAAEPAAAPEAESQEEATPVAAKLNRKIHRAPAAAGDPKEQEKKAKRDKVTVLRELLKKEFELSATEAEKSKGEVDTLISIGQDALNILTLGLAAPVQAAVTGGVAAVRGAIDLGIGIQRDALRQCMNHAIDNMDEAALEALAAQINGKEQTLAQQQATLTTALAEATSRVDAGIAQETAKMGGAGQAALGAATGGNDGAGSRALGAGLKTVGAGLTGWNAAKAFLGKAGAVLPAVGTLVSVGKLAWNMRKASKLEQEIKDLRKELEAMGDKAA